MDGLGYVFVDQRENDLRRASFIMAIRKHLVRMPRTDIPMAIGVPYAYTDVFPIIIDYLRLLHL